MDPKDKLTTSQIETAYERAKQDLEAALENGKAHSFNAEECFAFHINEQQMFRFKSIELDNWLEYAKENVRIPLRTMTVEEEAALAEQKNTPKSIAEEAEKLSKRITDQADKYGLRPRDVANYVFKEGINVEDVTPLIALEIQLSQMDYLPAMKLIKSLKKKYS